MANPDRPNGFTPHGKVLRTNTYTAGATIKQGDAVLMSTDGKIDPVATGGSSYTSFVLGIAAINAVDGDEMEVYDHPDQLYDIQADENDIAAQTDLFQNFAILATTGDTTFDTSRMELDSSTGATTNTLPLKAKALSKDIGNALGTNAKIVVRINNNQDVADTGSLGLA